MKSQEGNGTLASTKCHRIHVWYIYHYLSTKFGCFFLVNIGKYTIHGMDPMRTKGRNCKVSSSIGLNSLIGSPWESNCRGKSFKLSGWSRHGNIWQSVSVSATITDCGSVIASLTIADTKHANKNGTALPWLCALIPGCSPSSRGFFNPEPLGGRFFQILYVHPKTWGRCTPNLTVAYFQMGWWFNHQLDQIGPRKESPIESTNDFRRNVPLQRCGDSGCWFFSVGWW